MRKRGEKTKMSRETGQKAEYHVIEEVKQQQLEYEYKDDWYDMEIKGIKVEIKSAKLIVNNGKRHSSIDHQQFRSGRFDFTSKENREKQRQHNVWICFVLTFKDNYMTLGYVPCKEIKNQRYIPLLWIKGYRLRSVQEMLAEEGIL